MTTQPVRPLPSPQLCNMRLVCSKSWESLPEGSDDGVRHCDHCGKDVFRVRTARQREVAAALNRCVAVVGYDGEVLVMGNPERTDEWALMSKSRLEVQLLARPSDERLSLLARDFPVLFDEAAIKELLFQGRPVPLGYFEGELLEDMVQDLTVNAPELRLTVQPYRRA